jgi:hypothetical protein
MAWPELTEGKLPAAFMRVSVLVSLEPSCIALVSHSLWTAARIHINLLAEE